MARIPAEEIERLKREISIERLVEAHGIELKPHGKDLVGLCPFHADKGPSLVVTPAKNLWHCLGACQTGGSVIDWVMRSQGVSFRHAIEILRSDQTPAAPARPVKRTTVRSLPAPVDFTADDRALLKQVAQYYHETLKQSPEALAYMKTRGLTSPAIVERFQIGFANRTLGLRLPANGCRAGAEIRARLQKVGILRESGHEHFNGSIVIPILGEQGEVLGMYGRKITPHLRPGTPDHLYLPGPHKGVFNIEALTRYPEIILCEALIDALTFLDAGYPNVTASYGVNGFTPDHWDVLRRYKTQRVLIAYDRDEAGEKGASTLAAQLVAEGIECFRVQFPHGMDANAYALKVQPAAKSLGLVIRAAVWMGKGRAPKRKEEPMTVEVTPPALTESMTTQEATSSASVEVATLEAHQPAPSATESAAVIAAAQVSTPMAAIKHPASPPVPEAAAEAAPAPNPAESMPGAGPPEATAAEIVAPPASPVPTLPQPTGRPPVPPVERQGTDVRITLGDRLYRIRGLEMNKGVRELKVNVFVIREDRFHVETFDLYVVPRRAAYAREAAFELCVSEEVIKKDLGRVLLALEDLQEQERKASAPSTTPAVKLTPQQRDEALELLRDPRLLDRILEDFSRSGIAGEEINKLVGYLAGVSRKDENPLAVVIQSSSAAGKSSLMDAILAFIPSEDRVKYSAMTGQSLFYMGAADLKHKVLAIVEEEGAERASYALKLLQSEGELTIASTGKDPQTGRHVTHEYKVEGPVMIFLTTTAVEIDEELLNRCVVLSVNEDREQTRAIHKIQRERQTLEGQLTRLCAPVILERHQNAQRLLRPLIVANPYAPDLTFRDDQTRMRRDHGKYLTLIRAVTLLYQYQRPVRTANHNGKRFEYINVTRDDIRMANRLAHEVLGRTLDELSPQTRRVLGQLDGWVTRECERLQMARLDFRFQRKDVRALASLSEKRARIHLEALTALEYVVVHRGTRGQSFLYELVYDGQGKDGQPFLMGLIDPDALPPTSDYDGKFVPPEPEFVPKNGQFVPGSSPHRPPLVPGSAGGGNGHNAAPDAGLLGDASKSGENAVLDGPAPVISQAVVVPQSVKASGAPR